MRAKRSTSRTELVLFERALELYRSLVDIRGEAEAQFWIGTCHQVLRHDDAAAVPALQRARALATQADDPRALSYALRHLGIVEHRAGQLDDARRYLEESTRRRRQLGFGPGVAANLMGLAYMVRPWLVPQSSTFGPGSTSRMDTSHVGFPVQPVPHVVGDRRGLTRGAARTPPIGRQRATPQPEWVHRHLDAAR